jgi:transposase
MKPYSKDLRLRVLAAVDRGMPRAEAARIFGVSAPTIRRYLRLRQQTGDVEPKPVPGPPARKGAALEATLPAQVRANPDLTLAEHCELFEETEGVQVSTATISRAFKRLGLPLKKVPPGLRARRSRKGELARRNREVGPAPSGVRGRVWDAHLHDSSAGTGSQGREGLR